MVYNNKKQNCTLTDNGTNQSSCLNTDNQCAYEYLNYLSNPSFDKYYYPWCYYKPDSYMLFSNNRKINCRLPCNDINCNEKDLGIFNSDGSMNPAISRKILSQIKIIIGVLIKKHRISLIHLILKYVIYQILMKELILIVQIVS